MHRRVPVRPSRVPGARFAIVVSMLLSAGLGPLAPSAAAADTAQETVVPATLRSTHISASVLANGAGAQGVFHQLEGAGLVWTRYADGRSFPAPPDEDAATLSGGIRNDVLAYRHSGGLIDLWEAAEGVTATVRIPADLGLLSYTGTTVIAYRIVTGADGTSRHAYHLLDPASDGATRDVPVTGEPDGMAMLSFRGADDNSLVFSAVLDGSNRMVAVDRETGRVQGWTQPLTASYNQVSLSPTHVVVSALDSTKALVLPRSDLSATPSELVLDGAGTANPAEGLTVVGDWVVHRPAGGTTVLAKPLSGGASVTLASSDPTVFSTSYDTAVIKGRTTDDDWGIQRITPGDEGRPVVTPVKPLPRPPVAIQGLSLEQGRLIETDSGSGRRDDYLRTVAATGTPEFGDRSAFTGPAIPMGDCPVRDLGCSAIRSTADGRIAWVERESGSSDLLEIDGPGEYDLESHSVPGGGRITDLSGGYVIYTGGGLQYVYRLHNDAAPVTVPEGAGAVWGHVLLTAGTTPGTVEGFDLTTRTPAATLTTDADCVFTELQAVGRRLYWSCGPDGKAGVFDRVAGHSVPVPLGEARLGDGFVVTHDRAAGELTLTTVTDGEARSRVIGALPDTGISQRDVRWTVDEDGGNAAYVDAEERVHLVPSGVPQEPLRLLAPARSYASVRAAAPEAAPDTVTDVLLSKPSADWTLTVRDAQGKIVDTQHGGAARGELTIGWHGIDPARSGVGYFPVGRYAWSLSVTPADGEGAPLTVTGTMELTDVPGWRDLMGKDGYGDLLGLDGTGRVYAYRGTGAGGLAPKQASEGSTFPTTTLFVPFGDTDNDGCNDVLARVGDELRAYRLGCQVVAFSSSSYTSIGTAWGQYDVLTSPGDLNGDGHMDLIARQTSTGDMYFYAGTATHVLRARVRIGTNWKLYPKIVGAGDLNGDGLGDLLGIDGSGGLWRYYGRADGAITPRVRIASGWGTSYTAVLGVGDITGDGRTDIVARDTTGKLFRHSSTGNGTVDDAVMIGTAGWNTYKGLF